MHTKSGCKIALKNRTLNLHECERIKENVGKKILQYLSENAYGEEEIVEAIVSAVCDVCSTLAPSQYLA